MLTFGMPVLPLVYIITATSVDRGKSASAGFSLPSFSTEANDVTVHLLSTKEALEGYSSSIHMIRFTVSSCPLMSTSFFISFCPQITVVTSVCEIWWMLLRWFYKEIDIINRKIPHISQQIEKELLTTTCVNRKIPCISPEIEEELLTTTSVRSKGTLLKLAKPCLTHVGRSPDTLICRQFWTGANTPCTSNGYIVVIHIQTWPFPLL